MEETILCGSILAGPCLSWWVFQSLCVFMCLFIFPNIVWAPFIQWLQWTDFFFLFLARSSYSLSTRSLPFRDVQLFRKGLRDRVYTNIKYCLNCIAYLIPHCRLNMVSLRAIKWHNCSQPVSSSNSPERFTCYFWLIIVERGAWDPILE